MLESSLPPRSATPLSALPSLDATAAVAAAAAPTSTDGASFACPRCTFLNHPSLRACEICGERLISADLTAEQLQEVSRADSPAPISAARKGGLVGERVDAVKFSFRAGGDRAFHGRLKNALIQRKWLLQNAPPVPTPSSPSSSSSATATTTTTTTTDTSATSVNGTVFTPERLAGIAGLERQGINVRRKNEVAIGGAFEDLEALMGRAKEMVSLAEEFSTRLASTPAFANGEARAALSSSSLALGLVSKDMLSGSDRASDLYLSELARQLAEFLADDARGVLKREGGVITLVDLWALFNRARGIDLISPSDLEKAARLFEKLKLPVRLRMFRSGLLVVQDARSTDAETVRRILEWISGDAAGGTWMGRGVTASEAADRFGWSVGVAAEELEMAEERGALCREAGIEGLRFWKNWFAAHNTPST